MNALEKLVEQNRLPILLLVLVYRNDTYTGIKLGTGY